MDKLKDLLDRFLKTKNHVPELRDVISVLGDLIKSQSADILALKIAVKDLELKVQALETKPEVKVEAKK